MKERIAQHLTNQQKSVKHAYQAILDYKMEHVTITIA